MLIKGTFDADIILNLSSYPELRACLIQVSDTGRYAFLEAEKKMGLIGDASRSIGETVCNYPTEIP